VKWEEISKFKKREQILMKIKGICE